MKKYIGVAVAVISLTLSQSVLSKNLCTLVVEAETGKSLLQEGKECETKVTPASTFKIAISLMGFDAGILKTENEPSWAYQEGYPDWGGDNWKKNIDPASWMKYSVFWYSQQVLEQLGQTQFERYVNIFDYGNKDVSAVPVKGGHQNGVWVMSSLQISPIQQIDFLRKIINRQLPLTSTAYEMTEKITKSDLNPDGWIIYGKTGTGSPGHNNKYDPNKAYGWYVGWATKGTQKIAFAHLIQDEKAQSSNAGIRARDQLILQLPSILKH